MNTEILMSLVTLSGIAVAAGYMLNAFGQCSDEKFDERQLIERGRAANLSMSVGLCYLLGLYIGLLLELLPAQYGAVFAVYGLVVMIMVNDGWCIFHDAFLRQGENAWRRALEGGVLGILWLVLAAEKMERDSLFAWTNGALALSWLSRSGMLLLYTLIQAIRERRAAKEEADG